MLLAALFPPFPLLLPIVVDRPVSFIGIEVKRVPEGQHGNERAGLCAARNAGDPFPRQRGSPRHAAS